MVALAKRLGFNEGDLKKEICLLLVFTDVFFLVMLIVGRWTVNIEVFVRDVVLYLVHYILPQFLV